MVKRLIRVLGLLGLIAGLGVFIYDLRKTDWVGWFPLEVRLAPGGDRRPVKVWTHTSSQIGYSEAELRRFRGIDLNFQPVDKFDGSPFTLSVPCGGMLSGFGREMGYGEHRFLALKVEFADGEQQYRVVEIPEGRGRRSVAVPIP